MLEVVPLWAAPAVTDTGADVELIAGGAVAASRGSLTGAAGGDLALSFTSVIGSFLVDADVRVSDKGGDPASDEFVPTNGAALNGPSVWERGC